MSSQKYLCILSFASLSLLELSRLRDSGFTPFELDSHSSLTAIVDCDKDGAKKLARVTGGTFKIARRCGNSLDDLDECLPLPDESKFAWTISGYCCTQEDIEDSKSFVFGYLKDHSIVKSRFQTPEQTDNGVELRLLDLRKSVFPLQNGKGQGFDVVIDRCSGELNVGYTEFLSDVEGFRERDLSRPYQDPSATMSPRVARLLVNLCGLKRGMTILDPFCGLGTILQEALIIGLNAVGIEISPAESSRCRENLNWLRERFQVSSKISARVIRGDSTKIRKADLPKVDAIATEPILLPKLEKNPTTSMADHMISSTSQRYSQALEAFSGILNADGVVSIVAPDIIDDRGRRHEFDLFEIGRRFGFKQVHSRGPGIENPCSVPTAKRKMIQRRIYLMKLD